MAKERPLTERQIECLKATQDTLFGEVKISDGYGRTHRGLRNRRLIEGYIPHVYLTDAGKSELARICEEGELR